MTYDSNWDNTIFQENTSPNTYFLLNGEGLNGSTNIINTGIINVEYVLNGNVQISTAESKWGNGSIYFNGTGSFIQTASNLRLIPASNFTYEFFFWPISLDNSGVADAAGVFFDTRNNSYNSDSGIAPYLTDTGKIKIVIGGAVPYTTTTTITIGSWHHFAIVREAGTFSIYIDGTRDGTFSNNTTFVQSITQIGAASDGAGNDRVSKFYGYMNGFRYEPVAVYSGATYTVPTAPFPSINDDAVLGKTYCYGNGILTCVKITPFVVWKKTN